MGYKPMLFWGACAALLYGITVYFGSVVEPFWGGWLLAYALNPAVHMMQKLHLSRLAALVIILFGAVAGVIGVLYVTLPLMVIELGRLSHDLPQLISGLARHISEVFPSIPGLKDFKEFDWARMTSNTLQPALQGASHLMSHIVVGGQNILSGVVTFFIVLLSAFYFLRDWDGMMATLQKLLPQAYRSKVTGYALEIHDMLARFVRGQLSVCVLSAFGHAAGLLMVGLQGSIVLGLISGFLSFVPYSALLLGMPTAILIAALQGLSLQVCFVILAIFVVIHVIEVNILVPKFVGGELGIHPLWLIFIFFASANALGVWGVVLALPLSASLKVLVQIALRAYEESSYYRKVRPHRSVESM